MQAIILGSVVSACEAARLVQRERLGSEETTMRVLSYLRMEIDPYQIEAFEEDLEEMIWMAREMPGFLGVEVFRARTEPNVYLVLDSSGHGPSDAPGGSGVRFRVWLISSQT